MTGRSDGGRRVALTRRQFVGWSAAGVAALGGGLGTLPNRATGAGAAAELSTDVLVVGGGVGGVAAALAALRLGRTVILTEETDWIGGQLTAQAVPPDENPWIETTGCTASYRQFRNGVRQYYRDNYALRGAPYASPFLNPGAGNVSALCHEALVALAVLTAMLKPYQVSGKLTVLLRHRPTKANSGATPDRVASIAFATPGTEVTISASFILDATDLGDLLELAGVEHVTGAESQRDQGVNAELHALTGPADPLDQQAISWCFPMEYLPGETHTIARPDQYTVWRDYTPKFWTGKLLSWTDVHPETLQARTRNLFDGPASGNYGDMWHFRRTFWHDQCLAGLYPSDLTTVNWPQIDYWADPLTLGGPPATHRGDPLVGPGVTAAKRQTALNNAKQLSLSMLYWMQTEAPHADGNGVGYPGLRLRPDIVGTTDGLAKAAYIRESRRIKARFTVLEQHVGVTERRNRGLSASAAVFPDSVGIGYYRIDLHPSTGKTVYQDGTATYSGGRTYVDIESYRFQIPLGALVPQRVVNLLPAAKNIGTTHITNGCYRLHPVEWTIGEAAGALAAFCLTRSTPTKPADVYENVALRTDFQSILRSTLGFVLEWPDVTGQEYPDGKRYGGGG